MSKVRDVLLGFNDQALEALTSKGLLRRTWKDLETIKPHIIDETDSEIKLVLEDCEVQIPMTGPAVARCTCPATGVCRHILASVLFIRELSGKDIQDSTEKKTDTSSSFPEEIESKTTISSPDTENEVVSELLAYDLQQLRKWAGKARFNKAVDLLAEEFNIDTTDKARINVTIPNRGIQIFIIGQTGLDGIIVDGSTRDAKVEAVAAILFCQQQFGMNPTENLMVKSEETRTFNVSVVEKAMSLMENTVHLGLSHLSDAFSERSITIALEAVSAKLPRLSLLLRSIAEEIDLINDRVASADEGRLLRLIAQTYALCEALSGHQEKSKIEWMGQSRTSYEELDSVELHCISAYRWESKSDYHGITLVFWNEKAEEWLTWSDARPKSHSGGFEPTNRYLESAPWGVETTVERLAESQIELKNPRKNNQNRLSSSDRTKGRILSMVSPVSLNWGTRLFTNWSKLIEYRNSSMPMGLSQYQVLWDIVMIRPKRWGRRGFDPVKQEFFWPVEDEQDDSLLIKVPFNTTNEGSIAILESLSIKEEQIWGVIGRLITKNGITYLYPLSLLSEKQEQPLIHLTLDKKLEKPANWITKLIRERKVTATDYWEETVNEDIYSGYLSSVEDLLLRCAERGMTRVDQKGKDEIREAAQEMRRRSFVILADALENVYQKYSVRSILVAVYIVTLHYQAAAKIGREI